MPVGVLHLRSEFHLKSQISPEMSRSLSRVRGRKVLQRHVAWRRSRETAATLKKRTETAKSLKRGPNVEGCESGGAIYYLGKKRRKKTTKRLLSFFLWLRLFWGRRIERKRRRRMEGQERLSSLKGARTTGREVVFARLN